MRARDHASRHFDEMSRFASKLADVGGQVLDYSYSYLSLGSWTMRFRRKRTNFRLAYDGQKQTHVLEQSSRGPSPRTWTTIWRQASLNTEPPPDVFDAIVDASAG